MELKKVNLVTNKNRLRHVEHTQLIPKASDLIAKTCFVGLTYDLIYYLTLEHLKQNNEWFYDNSKYREIAFAMNYNKSSSESRLLEQKYLKRNQFFCHYYNFDQLENLDILCGYENIVIADLAKNFNIDNLESLAELEKIVKRLIKNGSKVYYLIPSFIFKPDDNLIYNADSVANNEGNFAILSKFKFIDQYFSYLRDYKKYPLYRVVIPNYINFFDYDFFANRTDIKRLDNSIRKIPNDSFFIDNFPFLSSDKLAGSLYALHLESFSKNYIIDSDFKISLHDLNKARAKYKKHKQENLIFNKSVIKVDNYSTEWYRSKIRESQRLNYKRRLDNSYIENIRDNEDKFPFKI